MRPIYAYFSLSEHIRLPTIVVQLNKYYKIQDARAEQKQLSSIQFDGLGSA